ncbi:GNAT family N-acetyltransferase [Terrisporobacter sp.]
MKYCGTKLIETDRLILRRFTLKDAENMYKNWASDDEVTKYLTWPTHSDISVTESVLKEWVSNYSHKDFYQWAITLKKSSDEVIGSIGVVSHDDRIKMVHIGYCIGKKWWHKGITSEALKYIIEFLFDKVQIERIESRHDTRNINSGAVMKKCNMKYERTLRKADWNNQGSCDVCYYGLLKGER